MSKKDRIDIPGTIKDCVPLAGGLGIATAMTAEFSSLYCK